MQFRSKSTLLLKVKYKITKFNLIKLNLIEMCFLLAQIQFGIYIHIHSWFKQYVLNVTMLSQINNLYFMYNNESKQSSW